MHSDDGRMYGGKMFMQHQSSFYPNQRGNDDESKNAIYSRDALFHFDEYCRCAANR
jgi:hypothetical protein